MTTTSALPVPVSAPALLADFDRWLTFLTVSRLTLRRYDRQLVYLGDHHPDLSHLSHYLRDCMRQRAQFFGSLASQLADKVAQLRNSPDSETLRRQLTTAHLVIQALITQLETAFAELEKSYSGLLPLRQLARSRSAPPADN